MDSARDSVAPATSYYWLRVLVGLPLAVVGGLVSAFFTFFIAVYIVQRVTGGEPLSSIVGLYTLGFLFGGLPLTVGWFLLRKASTRSASKFRWVLFGFFVILITVGVDSAVGPTNWYAVFRQDKALIADANALRFTWVTPHLDTSIAPGTNLLWCGTMQLAWNEACNLIGGELHFDEDHPMIAALNQREFAKDSIDESSYVAMAGFVRTNIHQAIREEVRRKFGSTFDPIFIPDPGLTPRPQDFIAYACLFKKLTFPNPFERLDDSLMFRDSPVVAFGLKEFKTHYTNLYSQVLILDYRDADDFVIELKARTDADRIILAKVKPEATLAATLKAVRMRCDRTNAVTAARDDILIVPRLQFDLTRRFSEIERRKVVHTNANLARDLYLVSAVQNTRFEMNEKGVELRSEAHTAFACGKVPTAVPKHLLVFDKPFLILLERTNTTMPYFALWVDNPEILMPGK